MSITTSPVPGDGNGEIHVGSNAVTRPLQGISPKLCACSVSANRRSPTFARTAVRRKQMSTLFKSPPSSFTRYEHRLPEGSAFTARTDAGQRKFEQNCRQSANVLRDDHIVLWAIDGFLALHSTFKTWRQRKRTLRALADLDDRQLRDIGLTRDQTHYHALAEFDDARSVH
jgi:uncharacterized protein YjiS (DUF1127 family)